MPFIEMTNGFNPGILFQKFLELRPDNALDPSSNLFLNAILPGKKHVQKLADPNFQLFSGKRPIGKNNVSWNPK